MRSLQRNRQPFWYCLYLNDRVPGDTAVVGVAITGISIVGDDTENLNLVLDEYGNETGERIPHYGRPVRMMASISPNGGKAQTEPNGPLYEYDRLIVTTDMDCPITESSILFIDKEPEYGNADTHEVIEAAALFSDDEVLEKQYPVPLYDYVVTRVSRSLNSIRIAVKRVATGENQC